MSLRYLSMSQLADVTGVDRRTIKARLEGIEPHEKHGKAIIFDSHQVLPIILGVGTEDPKLVSKALREEQLRYEKARADKIILDMEILRKEVVPIDDVCKAVEKEYTYVRATLNAIPSRRARALAVEDDPNVIQEMLRADIDEALDHLQADKNIDQSLMSSKEDKEQAEDSEE